MAKNEIHILILSSWYPTTENPFLGNFVERQAQLLGTRYRVTVVHTVSKESGGISLEVNQKQNFEEIIVYHSGKGNSISRKLRERTALMHGLNKLKKVDLIIGNVLLPKGWQFVLAEKKFHCPVFYIEHGSYFRKEKKSDWSSTDKWILRWLRKSVDETIAVSEFLKKDLEAYFPKEKIKVIGNHIDPEIFKPKTKKKKQKTQFLHISTLDKNTKNPQGIIEACKLLKKENDQFILQIISDEDYSEWKELVVQEELENNIEFLGPFDWKDLTQYYHQADAFILFSNYETFSIVLAEAWATGTPVISTPVGIAKEMSSKLGLSIELNNPHNLKDKMLQVMNKEVVFDENDLTEYANQYSSENILKEWAKLIESHVG